MQTKLAKAGVDVAMFALNDSAYAAQTTMSKATDFPVLNDTKAAGVYGKLGVVNKEYVYVWDKAAKLVSVFAPWEIGLGDVAKAAMLEGLLVGLARQAG